MQETGSSGSTGSVSLNTLAWDVRIKFFICVFTLLRSCSTPSSLALIRYFLAVKNPDDLSICILHLAFLFILYTYGHLRFYLNKTLLTESQWWKELVQKATDNPTVNSYWLNWCPTPSIYDICMYNMKFPQQCLALMMWEHCSNCTRIFLTDASLHKVKHLCWWLHHCISLSFLVNIHVLPLTVAVLLRDCYFPSIFWDGTDQ